MTIVEYCKSREGEVWRMLDTSTVRRLLREIDALAQAAHDARGKMQPSTRAVLEHWAADRDKPVISELCTAALAADARLADAEAQIAELRRTVEVAALKRSAK